MAYYRLDLCLVYHLVPGVRVVACIAILTIFIGQSTLNLRADFAATL